MLPAVPLLDSGGKLIFGNPTLLAQLLRDYSGMEILKDVHPEDIEDVTTRYIPMFTEERDSDVVKKVRLPEKGELFLITLIEHKSYVDYNVVMQLLRYMVYIWEDYEKQKEKELQNFTDQIRRRKMGRLFEGFEWYDVQATRKEIQDLKDELTGLKDELTSLKDENYILRLTLEKNGIPVPASEK